MMQEKKSHFHKQCSVQAGSA